MTRIAIKGLLARKTRGVLSAFAIVVGVAMISGTYVVTDSIHSAFAGVFASAYDETDVVVSGRKIVEGDAQSTTVPAGLLDEVRQVPGVEAASGSFLFREVRLIDRKGETIGPGKAAKFGFGLDPAQPRFNPLELKSGRWASAPREIVIDAVTAKDQRLAVGDTIAAKAEGPAERYRITGTAEIDGVGLGGATLAAFDVPTASRILDDEGRFDTISVAAASGVSDAELADRLRPLAPSGAEVRTAAQQDAKNEADAAERTGFIRTMLLAFAAIALFVGAFVIFNTISITVAQRTRELATLRTLGASRRQVLRTVVLEGAVIGTLASAAGVVAGIGLAKALNAMFVAMGASAPDAGTVFEPRTAVVAMSVGVGMTVVASVFPALRATRVPAISAVREGATLPQGRAHRAKPVAAGLLLLGGGGLIVTGLSGGGDVTTVLTSLGAGTLLLFMSVALMSSSLVRPLAAVAGLPSRRLGGSAGRLAARNAIRNPSRTAATAGALMVGLALVTFVGTLGSGLRTSTRDALDEQVAAHYVVTNEDDPLLQTFSAQAGDALAGVPGVTVASSVRRDSALVLGKTTTVVGVEPETIAAVHRFTWKQGSERSLAALRGGAIVDSDYAEEHGLKVGSPLHVQSASGQKRTFRVTATHHPPQADALLTGVIIGRDDFDRTFAHAANAFTFVKIDGTASAQQTARLEQALAPYPDANLQTRAAWATQRAKGIDTIITLFYVLLALSVVVSLFGMINTLVLSVFERTREIGMLRAIGMTRRQTRRMIRHESIITALIGAALGLPLGLGLAALASQALADEGVRFELPIVSLVAFTVVAVVAGVLAAVAPARRASRLDVLHALEYE
jgi:putative ABC transport system permease protein